MLGVRPPLRWILGILTTLTLAQASRAQQAPPTPPPMEEPVRLIHQAQEAYKTVNDYTCLFVKRERLRGQLGSDNLIQMQVRTQPYSVSMRWLKPKDLTGLEVCFVEGKNNGMLRARSQGLLGVVGYVSMEPTDPRALENNRHAITESGIGNLINVYAKRWELENKLNKTIVHVGEYMYDNRRCTRVETMHPDNSGKEFQYYRSVVYFDQASNLPIRAENYDWPRPGGDPQGALLESYSFAGLKLNVGVNPAVFSK